METLKAGSTVMVILDWDLGVIEWRVDHRKQVGMKIPGDWVKKRKDVELQAYVNMVGPKGDSVIL